MNKTKQPYSQLYIREQLFQECRAMAEYSFANGLQVPVNVAKTIDVFTDAYFSPEESDTTPVKAKPDLDRLITAHHVLSSLVKPALPRTILLLDCEQNTDSWLKILGPVSIIRQMMVALILSLAAFIFLALSRDITEGAGDILKSGGSKLLQNLLFYIAAAGLGAGFAALYKANSYIAQGTFDPTYDASYRIRFLLGLVAGLVLSVMVSDNALQASGGTASVGENSEYGINPALLRPMLAMLGGFSAGLLYTILNRLVETVESLFKGSTQNFIDMKQQEADTQLAASKAQSQISIATKLIELQREMGGDISPADIQAKIDKLLNEVMPDAGIKDT
ncbi:MAG: hypothetical protein ACN4GM_11885 [Gammaproteobacteria bacterium]